MDASGLLLGWEFLEFLLVIYTLEKNLISDYLLEFFVWNKRIFDQSLKEIHAFASLAVDEMLGEILKQ